MKLAFSGNAHYPDFTEGYELYLKRNRTRTPLSFSEYKRVIKRCCKDMAGAIEADGFVDLPSGLGMLAAATITRRPQYRGKKFIGYGKRDWKTGEYDGSLKTFGIVFLPRHGKNDNLRCFGFVANRQLFKRVKEKCGESFMPMDFNNDMI